MSEGYPTPIPDQFQVLPPKAESAPQQIPSHAATEVHTSSPVAEYMNEIKGEVTEAEQQVEHAREHGLSYTTLITKEEQDASAPIYMRALAGEQPTKEEMERYNAVIQPGVNKPLIAAEQRLNRLRAESEDHTALAARVQQDIATAEAARDEYRAELSQSRGNLEGDDLYFPLKEELLEKEKLQAQAPTPERAVIINLLKEQMKKTKRGEAAAGATSSQERIDFLAKVQQSIPLPITK